MRRSMILSGLFGVLALATGPIALAQDNERSAAGILAAALARVENPDGVFRIAGEDVIHVQSGLDCPAHVGNAFLAQVSDFDADQDRGAEVGCEYGRRATSDANDFVARHTIYAVKLPDGGTLDGAFAQSRQEMYAVATQGVHSNGPSLIMTGGPDGFPEFRSEEILYRKGAQVWKTELIVALLNGWIVEMRSTRAPWTGQPGEISDDQNVGAMLFFKTVHALGGPEYNPEYISIPLPPPDPGTKL